MGAPWLRKAADQQPSARTCEKACWCQHQTISANRGRTSGACRPSSLTRPPHTPHGTSPFASVTRAPRSRRRTLATSWKHPNFLFRPPVTCINCISHFVIRQRPSLVALSYCPTASPAGRPQRMSSQNLPPPIRFPHPSGIGTTEYNHPLPSVAVVPALLSWAMMQPSLKPWPAENVRFLTFRSHVADSLILELVLPRCSRP